MAMTNRSATKEIGGRSRNPTLIASQVELQTMQRVSQAAGIRQPIGCIRGDTRAERSRRKGAALRSVFTKTEPSASLDQLAKARSTPAAKFAPANRLLRRKSALACDT